MTRSVTLQRLLVGGFLAPPHVAQGQRVVVNAWVLRHPEATILIDTGVAPDLPPDDVRELAIVGTPILDVLADAGIVRDEIDAVINCHLHADHAGGNAEFRGIPIYAQRAEIDAAREPEYTVARAVDLDGGSYRPLDGAHEVVPGVRILPTPGHSPGHQAVVVDTTEGRVVLAGQSFRLASDVGMAITALRLAEDGYPDPPPHPEWFAGIMELDPWRIVVAHDRAIWQRDG